MSQQEQNVAQFFKTCCPNHRANHTIFFTHFSLFSKRIIKTANRNASASLNKEMANTLDYVTANELLDSYTNIQRY